MRWTSAAPGESIWEIWNWGEGVLLKSFHLGSGRVWLCPYPVISIPGTRAFLRRRLSEPFPLPSRRPAASAAPESFQRRAIDWIYWLELFVFFILFYFFQFLYRQTLPSSIGLREHTFPALSCSCWQLIRNDRCVTGCVQITQTGELPADLHMQRG